MRQKGVKSSPQSFYHIWTMKKVTLQLVGIDGNAFAILGAFRRQATREGWSKDEIQEALDEATSSDYDHLLQTIISRTTEPE